jgi:hypothetical protein
MSQRQRSTRSSQSTQTDDLISQSASSNTVNGDVCHGNGPTVDSCCPHPATTAVNGEFYEDPAVMYEKLTKAEEVNILLCISEIGRRSNERVAGNTACR